MTYKEAMSFLEDSNQYGSVLGLDSMKSLLDGLDNPQDRLRFVHVAGTNGKGSTAAYIATIMAVAGYQVGRYISPFVLEHREIIQIFTRNLAESDNFPVNARYISEEEVVYCIEKIKIVCNQMVEAGLPHPTVFEIETAMAMLYFLNKGCNLVVLEVGLGGRLDATNVITTTECAVLTSISMDHMQILGHTLEQIAFEKAGIIKPGIQVVSYGQKPEAMKIINKTCDFNKAELTVADFNNMDIESFGIPITVFSYEDLTRLKIQLLGENQVKNAIVAILAIKALQKIGYVVKEEDIRVGLFHTQWRGRFELLKTNPLFIIDGAHNEEAAEELAKNIKKYFNNNKLIFIMGVLADKDYEAVLKQTGSFAKEIITITPDNPRGLQSGQLALNASRYCRKVIDAQNISTAIKQAYKDAYAEDVILAFGSLSFHKEIYEELKAF